MLESKINVGSCFYDSSRGDWNDSLDDKWHCPFLQIILDAIEQVGGIYVVTADHGNAEDMVKRNKSGQPLLDKSGNIQILTSHTLQPVSTFEIIITVIRV